MIHISDIIYFIVNTLIFSYAIALASTYVLLSIISYFALTSYIRKNSFIDYDIILSSPLAPAVSVIAPAFNESKTIVENVRTLLSLYYNDYEVIVVNDGSVDDSLEKIIKEYEMVKVDFAVNNEIETQQILGVYKSLNKAFGNLIVVDKLNGGKADALNAGINISTKDYFVAIDVDSIIEQDALLKLAKPFMEEKSKRVIAVGGVIRIANSSIVKGGNLEKVKLPIKLLPRFQILEYERAFLMGRMAWSKLNGLLLISGALGMFDREIVSKCGGYYNHTVGEDMELVVRMRRYMADNKQKYKVAYIPDPLCWTEVPDTVKMLGRQRNRWTRGTIDTLRIHRKLFFNPKYGALGLLGYPFWFFFEWLAPLVEVFGITYFVALAILGSPNWSFFFLLLAFVYLFAITFSTYSLLFEEMTFHRFEKKSDILKLFLTACIEPLIYHPMNTYFAVKGNFDYFVKRKRTWGQIDRKGFSTK